MEDRHSFVYERGWWRRQVGTRRPSIRHSIPKIGREDSISKHRDSSACGCVFAFSIRWHSVSYSFCLWHFLPKHELGSEEGPKQGQGPVMSLSAGRLGRMRNETTIIGYWNQSAHLETIPTASPTTKCHSAENSFFRSWLSSFTFPEIPNGTE